MVFFAGCESLHVTEVGEFCRGPLKSTKVKGDNRTYMSFLFALSLPLDLFV